MAFTGAKKVFLRNSKGGHGSGGKINDRRSSRTWSQSSGKTTGFRFFLRVVGSQWRGVAVPFRDTSSVLEKLGFLRLERNRETS